MDSFHCRSTSAFHRAGAPPPRTPTALGKTLVGPWFGRQNRKDKTGRRGQKAAGRQEGEGGRAMGRKRQAGTCWEAGASLPLPAKTLF